MGEEATNGPYETPDQYTELIQVNDNALGARTVMRPTNFKPERLVWDTRQRVPFLLQRMGQYEDFSIVPECNHPPYETKPTEPWIGIGMAHKYNSFPIIY
jgi:hypothetical protein